MIYSDYGGTTTAFDSQHEKDYYMQQLADHAESKGCKPLQEKNFSALQDMLDKQRKHHQKRSRKV
jgi:hypothetical protein